MSLRGSRQEPDARQGQAASSAAAIDRPDMSLSGLEETVAGDVSHESENRMPAERRPSSIDGIKRFAKLIKAQRGVTHAVALNEAARLAGFDNYPHARRALTRMKDYPMPHTDRSGGKPPALSAFHARSLAAWTHAVDTIDPDDSTSKAWTSRSAIITALEPFMGLNNNHAHLPSGGGHDFTSVGLAREPGCIEFGIGSSTAYIVKPKRLTLERIEEAVQESFLLLELDDLSPSGAYEADDDDDEDGTSRFIIEHGSEELLEVAPGEYVERGVWDRGYLGHDAQGRERPLPRSARLVVRWLRGKILLVAKGSLWNGDSGTYDGRHNRASSTAIRNVIERSRRANED